MLSKDLPDLAIRGEGGIDIFARRLEAERQRARFFCLGRICADGGVEVFEKGITPERLMRAAAQYPPEPQRLDLADATSFPPLLANFGQAGPKSTLELFLRLEFLRAYAVAAQALLPFETALAKDPAAVTADGSRFAGHVALAYDFNRISLGITFARLALPALPARRLLTNEHGFALRMLGDLAMRGHEAGLCFEAALAAGANPHRRARALAAARALGHDEAIARHSTGLGKPAPTASPNLPAKRPAADNGRDKAASVTKGVS